MYGNTLLPGVTAGASYRNDGSIWRGYTEATWFQTVKVSGEGEEATKIPLGTILIQNLTDGTYTPLTESGIVISASGLPGSRLGIAADTTGTSGTARPSRQTAPSLSASWAWWTRRGFSSAIRSLKSSRKRCKPASAPSLRRGTSSLSPSFRLNLTKTR